MNREREIKGERLKEREREIEQKRKKRSKEKKQNPRVRNYVKKLPQISNLLSIYAQLREVKVVGVRQLNRNNFI